MTRVVEFFVLFVVAVLVVFLFVCCDRGSKVPNEVYINDPATASKYLGPHPDPELKNKAYLLEVRKCGETSCRVDVITLRHGVYTDIGNACFACCNKHNPDRGTDKELSYALKACFDDCLKDLLLLSQNYSLESQEEVVTELDTLCTKSNISGYYR